MAVGSPHFFDPVLFRSFCSFSNLSRFWWMGTFIISDSFKLWLLYENKKHCTHVHISWSRSYHDQDHIMIKMFNFAVKRWIIKIFYNKIQNPKVRGLNRFALMSSAGANYPQCIMGLFGSSRLAACSSKFTDLLPCDVRRISDNFRKWI